MEKNKADRTKQMRVAYLVGGLRIGLGENSTTPGPRNHILNFVEALRRNQHIVDLFVVSQTKLLRGFSSIPEGVGGTSPKWKTLLGDGVRVGAMLVSGGSLFVSSLRSEAPDVIYERLAVMQSLSSFHRYKRNALRVVESNGIMSRETARDRGALIIEPLARRIEIHAYKHADKIVTVSEALADEVAKFAGIARDKIVVVPNAIPFRIMDVEPTPPAPGAVTIGFTGAVVEWQQLDMLLRAVAEIAGRSNEQKVSVEIVGDGPAVPSLKKDASRLGIETLVTFRGSLPPAQVLERMGTWTVGYSGHKRSSGEKMYHSPLKLYEYAGMGLGAISTPSDDAQSLSESGMPVSIFRNEKELVEAIAGLSQAALAEYRIARYRSVRESHSWNSRIEGIFTTS